MMRNRSLGENKFKAIGRIISSIWQTEQSIMVLRVSAPYKCMYLSFDDITFLTVAYASVRLTFVSCC